MHTGRSAQNHLRAIAANHRNRPPPRPTGHRPGRTRRRRRQTGRRILPWAWANASASPARLLADPATILLDEPVNGLDPEGVLWIRTLLKSLAAEGRTVFVSSHLMMRWPSPPTISSSSAAAD